ncbi:unnamed protein product [Lymnaea stagnalis]|uniref:tRNA (34-2'-O)-methyltransferase regulator WDR6 n=1 Tax=Lymnaea stagnalis TaxID=6523 RepID=A0AAV2GXZ6_LYMST
MTERYSIELENYTGPVTALTVINKTILCGCGSEVSFFDIKTSQLKARTQILNGATVHGLKRGPGKESSELVCVFGSKQARVILINITETDCTLSALTNILHVEDWIWDAHWLSGETDDGYIVLALAHNSVLKWKWKSNEITDRRECTEKCLLYCAYFIGRTWDGLVLAAGTVFNQVVLWPVAGQCQVNASKQEPVEVVHVLSGHKGVIFSIDYHVGHQRICSVSDDRSIRLWQLTFPSTSSNSSVPDWSSVNSNLMLSLFGHSARVWDVILMSDCFASVGEDATCLIWDYEGNIINKLKGHKGRSIWSLAITEDELFVLTGGGDASIRRWEVRRRKNKETSQTVIDIPGTCKQTEDDFPRSVEMLNFDTVIIMMNSGKLCSFKVTDHHFNLITYDAKFKSYSIVCPSPDQTTLAIGTMCGCVKVIRFRELLDDDEIFTEEKFFEGKVLNVLWLDPQHILVSGPHGSCLLLAVETSDESDAAMLHLRLLNRIFLPASKHRWISAACFVPAGATTDSLTRTLVCGDKDGSIHMYTLMGNLAFDELAPVEPHQSFTRVHGKAGVTFVCYREESVYTTGRDGFYRQWRLEEDRLVQLHGNKMIKGFEWIDRLVWHGDDLQVYGFFSSQFVVWSVAYNQQLMSVTCGGGHRAWGCCHEHNIMRFVYIKAGSVYMVDQGSRAQQTIVQPPLHGREVCDVKLVKVMSHDSSQPPVFAVLSASEDTTVNIGVFTKSHNTTSWEPLVAMKGHLSSVRALALSPIKSVRVNEPVTEHNDSNFLLFTGGGRAEIQAWQVKISCYNPNEGNVDAGGKGETNLLSSDCTDACENLEEPKTNSIKEVTLDASTELFSNDAEKDVKISTDVSGRLQTYSSNHVGCTFEHLSTHFLGESRHKQIFSSWKSRKLRLDPETRIMSIAASPVAPLVEHDGCGHNVTLVTKEEWSQCQVVSTAGSDGAYRVFLFNEASRNFSLLAKSSYHHGCVLKVLHYKHKATNQLISDFAFSAATSGQIVVWSLNSLVNKASLSLQCDNSIQNLASKIISDAEDDTDQDECGEEEIDEEADSYIDFTNRDNETETTLNEESWPPLCSLKAHQSGINSLHALQVSESSMLLASGGDDNAIVVHLLEISSQEPRILAKTVNSDAHSAQITGIWLVSPNLLVSASIDQRVNVWSLLHIEKQTIEIQLISCKFVNVANVSSIDVKCNNDTVYLCIGGEGLCLYKFQADTLVTKGQI